MKIPTGGLLSPPNPQNRHSGNLTLDGKKRRFRTWKINQQHRQICEKKPAISVTSGKFWKYRIETSTIFAKLKNFMQEEMVSSHFPPSIFPYFSNCYLGVVPCKTNLTQPVPFDQTYVTQTYVENRRFCATCPGGGWPVARLEFSVFRKPWGFPERKVHSNEGREIGGFKLNHRENGWFSTFGIGWPPNIINPTKKHLIYLVGIL